MTDPDADRTVVGLARRPVDPEQTFADLGVVVAAMSQDERGRTVLVFTEPLDSATRVAIYDRMTSTDDADQANRAHLRDLLLIVEAGALSPEGDLLVALTRRLLDLDDDTCPHATQAPTGQPAEPTAEETH